MTSISITDDSAGITDVPGFQTQGVSCNIRRDGKNRLDLAIIYSTEPCTAAAVFTQNDVKAAPVKYCQQILSESETFHGIVANSGNANACTGEQGDCDATLMGTLSAESCGAPKNSFFVCSTGRIGRALPIDLVKEGIQKASTSLGSSDDHGKRSAQAILTSDSKTKTVTASIAHNNKTITIAGIAKGAGMIQPDMATMLAFIATDVAIAPALFQKMLRNANRLSFNAISVDGDMSTNDTVIALANGHSGIQISSEDSDVAKLFQDALTQVCKNLAAKIVKDGELVSKFITLNIQGAKSESDAEKVARAIANSLLVKTSWFGNDPNWGRVMDAAGYARVGLQENKLDFFYDECPVIKQGRCIHDNLPQWKAIVSKNEFTITINLNLGQGSYSMLTADLTEGYVNYNKSE